MAVKIRSFSKINLGLTIGPVRPDGFHSLATVYQTLELHDLVTVEAAFAPSTSITLACNEPRVPASSANTAWRMAEAFLAKIGRAARVHIYIEKRLPVEGGLGAGSANAAATLFALEQQLGIELDQPARLRLAAEVGSDVPLFIPGGMVLGAGRGEILSTLPDSPPIHCVLALPGVGVSTARAFQEWDKLISLTGSESSSRIEKFRASVCELFDRRATGVFPWEDLAESPLLALVRTGIENDFERVVFPRYPSLGEIKRVLKGSGDPRQVAAYAALSGSGSAVFGLYSNAEAAERAQKQLNVMGVSGVLTRTLPRSEYETFCREFQSVEQHPANVQE